MSGQLDDIRRKRLQRLTENESGTEEDKVPEAKSAAIAGAGEYSVPSVRELAKECFTSPVAEASVLNTVEVMDNESSDPAENPPNSTQPASFLGDVLKILSDGDCSDVSFELSKCISNVLVSHLSLVCQGVFSLPACLQEDTGTPSQAQSTESLSDNPLLHLILDEVRNTTLGTDSSGVLSNSPPSFIAKMKSGNFFSALESLASALSVETNSKEKVVTPIFKKLLQDLNFRMRSSSIEDDNHTTFLAALGQLSGLVTVDGKRPVASLMVMLPNWKPPLSSFASAHGKIVEQLTFLGPFLSSSVFADDDNTRAAVLDFLSDGILLNLPRSQLHYDSDMLASEGFMLNISVLFQRLSAPIDQTCVDPNYLYSSHCRVDLKDITRLDGTMEDAQAYVEQLALESTPPPKFSTECFYFTAWALNCGLMSSIRKHRHHITKTERLLERTKLELACQKRALFCSETVLMHKSLLQSMSVYYASLAQFIMRVAEADTVTCVSRSKVTPKQFAFLPEFFVDDIADFLLFVARYLTCIFY
ncbi:unnamed protein product [Dibothriocephalus latus]|uniref:Ubiquitin conjugation factor E4 core domain-containing protein n=1 Tax=Dibothriocephalus latus TaxID=60516 RepID=A0A3P6UDJ1_DIBLA|nr:unnamed protein product [Dibothriocephalus latus]